MENTNKTESDHLATVADVVKPSIHPCWAWIALAIALAAWVVLIFGDGFVALSMGFVGLVIAIYAACRSHSAIKRLAVIALIASAVLVVVMSAFLIALLVVFGS